MPSADNQSKYNSSGREREHLKACAKELFANGDYYIHTIPSQIDFNRLIETEDLLNALFVLSHEFGFDEEIIRRIENRLGNISFLVHELRSGHTRFNADTFIEIKKSGRELVEIAELIRKYTA